jgi:DNA-binding response OmpR family regulator
VWLLVVADDLAIAEFATRRLSEAGYRADRTGAIETTPALGAKEASLSTKAVGNPLR